MLVKRGVCLGLSLFLLVFLSSLASSTLGISPASINKDFTPSMEEKIGYSVSSDNRNQELVAYKKGDLEEYLEISKTSLLGSDRFNVKMDLPEELERPGDHRTIVGVREKTDEELATVGTSVAVQSVINIYVPFPGKYLKTSLEADSVNQGEISEMLLTIQNEGKQSVSMKPRIEIIDKEGRTIETIRLSRRNLDRSGEIDLKAEFNTSNHKPGNYKAKAIVDYAGKNSTDVSNFSIGHLFVNVTGHTNKVRVGGLRKFNVDIESEWAEKIRSVYADVEVIENISSRKVFRTTPETLEPWDEGELTGYFDTTNMSLGTYDTRVFLSYEGEENIKEGEVRIYKEEDKFIGKIGYIVLGLIAIILIILVLWLIHRRRKKNEKK